MFIERELGRVGLGEVEAKRRGIALRVARLPMSSVLRARTIGETRGFMKVLIDARSDRILGFTMLGSGAGEVIAAVQSAMLAGLAYTGLRDAILMIQYRRGPSWTPITVTSLKPVRHFCG